MRIWAHRGCSQRYPENTLMAFEKAMQIKGLTGIELDIQMTKDGYLVVCHDERVDRTTDGMGYIQEYTLAGLKKLAIATDEAGRTEQIPMLEEVLDLLGAAMKRGLKLNIELKNSIVPYEGMEEKVVNCIHERGLGTAVIYSTFYARSLEKLKELDSKAELGILDTKVSDCIYKQKGGCRADALHPFWKGMDLTNGQIQRLYPQGISIRAWFSGHLYPEKPTGARLDLDSLKKQGITDVILNEPEAYL